MLEIRIYVNLKNIGSIVILRDRTDLGRVCNYTVKNHNNHQIGRIKDFDTKRGAWQLLLEALKVVDPDLLTTTKEDS